MKAIAKKVVIPVSKKSISKTCEYLGEGDIIIVSAENVEVEVSFGVFYSTVIWLIKIMGALYRGRFIITLFKNIYELFISQ